MKPTTHVTRVSVSHSLTNKQITVHGESRMYLLKGGLISEQIEKSLKLKN